MRRVSYKKYLVLLLALLLLMSLPPQAVVWLRNCTLAFIKSGPKTPLSSQDELYLLQAENHLLKLQLKTLTTTNTSPAIVARVIFRDPTNWSSSLWINVGHQTNAQLDQPIICLNSPVVLGESAVGVIDYVGKKQSRVRLITDSGLKPSVRVLRESADTTLFLAKGILQGAAAPLWRSSNQVLKGIGFNYDFADSEGTPRELQTGKLVHRHHSSPCPLIQVDDVLVTTGMDGVFPQGLKIAQVTKVFPLKEGAYAYELEAKPIVGNLDHLDTIEVMPPIGYDPNDQPSYAHI